MKWTNFDNEIEEHKGNDWVGSLVTLIIGAMAGVLIVFLLAALSEMMV